MKSRRGELGMLLKSPTNKTGARVSFEPFVPAYSDHNMSPNNEREREREIFPHLEVYRGTLSFINRLVLFQGVPIGGSTVSCYEGVLGVPLP